MGHPPAFATCPYLSRQRLRSHTPSDGVQSAPRSKKILMGMEYVIFGTSHTVQDSGEFESSTVTIIDRYEIKLIAEEYPFDTQSRVGGLAKRRHIPYLQIDLFHNEWAIHGIDWEMKARCDEACLQNDDVRFSHADLIRENFWLDKIEGGGLEDGQVLIICGYLHLHFLATNVWARGGGTVVEKCTYPTSLLDRSPTKTLSPDELKKYLREQNNVTGI